MLGTTAIYHDHVSAMSIFHDDLWMIHWYSIINICLIYLPPFFIYPENLRKPLPSGLSPPRLPRPRTQTRHLETRDFRSSPLFLINVFGCWVWNILSGSMVVNQKLYLSEKKWQVPLAPWHSMNGFGLNSCRQDPDEESDCPAPVLPAPAT